MVDFSFNPDAGASSVSVLCSIQKGWTNETGGGTRKVVSTWAKSAGNTPAMWAAPMRRSQEEPPGTAAIVASTASLNVGNPGPRASGGSSRCCGGRWPRAAIRRLAAKVVSQARTSRQNGAELLV
eukprot:scaffold150273_cov19-Prasinocladus_malaysianus.AAC.1